MNYLAHIYFSGSNKQMQLGGFIADFVKGNKQKKFSKNIWFGITLHRYVDDFTDNHEAVKHAIRILKPTFGRYSGIIIDMYFDYFLAKNFTSLTSNRSLFLYSIQFSLITLLHFKTLPIKVRSFILHFIFTNRLYQYRTKIGLYRSLKIMESYKIKSLNSEKCIEFLTTNEDELYSLFLLLFNDLEKYTKQIHNTSI